MSSKIFSLIFRSVAVLLYFDLICCNVSPKECGKEIQSFSVYPYIVLVKLKIKNSYCTGILMTPDWVLTAAHCMYKENETSIRVFLGRTQPQILINKEYNQTDCQYRDSSKFHIPWGWKYAMGDVFGKSDIAIIKLQKKFDIPSFRSKDFRFYHFLPMSTKKKCKIIGFNVQSDLIEKDIWVQKQCTDNAFVVYDEELRFLSWFCQIDNNFIEDMFSKNGALLFCLNNETKPELAGIAAGKIKLPKNNLIRKNLPITSEDPVVFTDLCPYLTWIHSFVGYSFPLTPGDKGFSCYFVSSSQAKVKIPFLMYFLTIIGILLNIINTFFKL